MGHHKTRVKDEVNIEHETSCDFCGKALSEANRGLALVTNFVIRVGGDETQSTKPSVLGDCYGLVCLGCLERVDVVLKAAKRQPHRVTLGLENESMLSRVGVALPLPDNRPIRHAEIQNFNSGLMVTYVDKEDGSTRRFHVNTRTGLRAELPS